mmetsp:Transcript_36809/g.63265  ORF Transcript_36809/g.63265 Transcript_36809/m.63265 type:complete len:140 (-) Transcript_36809:13-432(-)
MPVQCNKWRSLGETFETRAESAQLLVSTGPHWNLDVDSAKKIERAHLKMSKFQHQLANEPSLGLFHVQEHIKKSIPKIVVMQKELDTTTGKIKTVTCNVEDATKTITTLTGLQSFKNIKETSTKARQLLEQMTKQRQQS